MIDLDIIENPENGSWGFRIPKTSDASNMYARRFEKWLLSSDLSPDDFYSFVTYDGNICQLVHEFWFVDRETAVMVRLAV